MSCNDPKCRGSSVFGEVDRQFCNNNNFLKVLYRHFVNFVIIYQTASLAMF